MGHQYHIAWKFDVDGCPFGIYNAHATWKRQIDWKFYFRFLLIFPLLVLKTYKLSDGLRRHEKLYNNITTTTSIESSSISAQRCNTMWHKAPSGWKISNTRFVEDARILGFLLESFEDDICRRCCCCCFCWWWWCCCCCCWLHGSANRNGIGKTRQACALNAFTRSHNIHPEIGCFNDVKRANQINIRFLIEFWNCNCAKLQGSINV